ncbi:MFS/sugar transport protein [Arthrobacter sp. 31Cvi3.1E]|nr:MFS/sugar transport protein [Arthrobacter sp. 31Cvi3.1E]
MSNLAMKQEARPPAASASYDAPAYNQALTGQSIGGWFVTSCVLAQIGVWIALMTPASVTLSLRVAELAPGNKAASLGAIAAAGAAAALFANPVAGALSDRSTSRFGQRRPFIVVGFLMGALSVVGLGLSPNLLLVGTFWVLAQIGFNAALAALISVMPERIPASLRGRVSGFSGMTIQVGVVGGTFLAQIVGTTGAGMFLWPAVAGAVLLLPFAMTIKESPRSRNDVTRISLRVLLTSLWINPLSNPQFGLAWLGRAFVWTAVALLTTYKTYFLIDHLGYSATNVGPILTLALFILAICLAVSSIASGWLSDKIGRRKPFVVAASVVLVAAMLVVAFAGSVEHFLLGVGIAGFAQGMYMGVDYALVSSVLPDRKGESARGMGVFNLSATIPQTIAPVLAPVLLSINSGDTASNYTSLYLAAAVLCVIGAGFVQLIRGVR